MTDPPPPSPAVTIAEPAPGARRCEWAASGGPLDIQYHDSEWGVPVHKDQALFEILTLEGAQAGLSWSIILKKRQGYRRAFASFDPDRVARFNRRSVQRLLRDAGIVRNRLKIESTIGNARVFLQVQEQLGSFDRYVWDFVDGEPVQNRWKSLRDLPVTTAISDAMSRDFKRRGFRFVGPTICYAFMQAAGLVNDHTTDCFRHAELAAASRSL